MRSRRFASHRLVPVLSLVGLLGCAREPIRLAPVVGAVEESDRLRRMPHPSRPLLRYADLPIADSLAHPDSVEWLLIAQDRRAFHPDPNGVRICPDDSAMDAVRAAVAYTDWLQWRAATIRP